MSPFEAGVAGWHDFYLAVASASAALLGLLFVGVSIGIASVASDDRGPLLARAAQAFANLSLTLALSLLVLIPDQSPRSLAVELAAIAAVGLAGMGLRVGRVVRRLDTGGRLALVRRFAWSLLGDAALLAVALALWNSPNASADLLSWLLFAVFVFLMGAAEVAWNLLVLVSEDSARGAGSGR